MLEDECPLTDRTLKNFASKMLGLQTEGVLKNAHNTFMRKVGETPDWACASCHRLFFESQMHLVPKTEELGASSAGG